MTKNNVYLMTEFCELGDLQQHIRKQGRLSDLEALHIIRDVADGYLAIEEKLIVHRDLKPEVRIASISPNFFAY